MNPKLCKRFTTLTPKGNSHAHPNRTISIGSEGEVSKKTPEVRDAELLLSIADICKSEIKSGGMANLWRDDLTLPEFPCLSPSGDSANEDEERESKFLSPRADTLCGFVQSSGQHMIGTAAGDGERLRSVSFDNTSPLHRGMTGDCDRVSPVAFATAPTASTNIVSPIQQSPVVAGGIRIRKPSQKARGDILAGLEVPFSPTTTRRTKSLQGPCPPGVSTRSIHRKKFSWKNYPEVSFRQPNDLVLHSAFFLGLF